MDFAKMLFLCAFLVTILFAGSCTSTDDCTINNPMWEPDKKNTHPCYRECVPHQTMKCYFHFVIEKYYSMSKACYNCPSNMTDCKRKDCVPVDGLPRVIYTCNRQIPGPAIEVCYGDTVIIVLDNRMNDESTTIHWHGLLQEHTPYMDGVPMITQCPIPPGDSMTYTFYALYPGTHFWHGHVGIQRTEGLFGAFIVRKALALTIHHELYDYDIHTIVLNDWTNATGAEVLMKYFHLGGNNAADRVLCNGKGRVVSGSTELTKTPIHVIHVVWGHYYRIRCIFAGSYACPIMWTVDKHNFTAIAADGFEFEPVTVEGCVINPAERFDVIIKATQAIGNYLIRFVAGGACAGTKAMGYAILHYEGAPCTEPNVSKGYDDQPTPKTVLNPLNPNMSVAGQYNLANLSCPYYPEREDILHAKVDQKIYVWFDFEDIDNYWYHRKGLYGFYDVAANVRTLTPQFYQMSFKTPKVPLLSQYCQVDPNTYCDTYRHVNCSSEYCECCNVIDVKCNAVVEIILVNLGAVLNATHPFHLHGYAFHVCGMQSLGSKITLKEVQRLDRAGLLQRNLKHPPLKDTVSVPDGGYTILRFRANNAGYWFFHCHFEIHLESKMALVFKVCEHEDFPPVPKGFLQCGYTAEDNKPACTPRPKKHCRSSGNSFYDMLNGYLF